MRYYELTLTKPEATTPFRTWTTHPNGIFDPGALWCEFDLTIVQAATPAGGSTVRLHGVSMSDLSQAQQFGQHRDAQGKFQQGMTLTLKGGMAAGLPLANPAQAGMLVTGQVVQSYGTWLGIEQHVDFVVLPSTYTHENLGNFTLIWRRGQPLSDALKGCLQIAYPDSTIRMNIDSRLVATEDMPHIAGSLESLAQVIKRTTLHWLGPTYPGVEMVAHSDGTIEAYDNSVTPAVVQLNISDLIGQPTWINQNVLQIDLVLRADIAVNTQVKMPAGMIVAPGSVGTSQQSMPGMFNYQGTFAGNFLVNGVRHIGDSRSRNASQWGTHLQCVPMTSSAASSGQQNG